MDSTSLPSSRVPAHVSYAAGFVVLSYFISLVGSWTTLELLHRRTSIRGAYNWFLLIASCITMGGVAIWCMHFIGNRAIVLDAGTGHPQIAYNAGFTALSFFLPILVLLMAFYLLGMTDNAEKTYLTLGGFLTGAAVCGMHYVGQLGISNYSYKYRIANVAGAALIAVAASLIALSVFFRSRERWTNDWWKRGLCAAILACAVSGMHWTAAVGTEYYIKTSSPSSGSRVQTVIVATLFSISACVILLISAFVVSRKQRIIKNRAQELVLACAYFDSEGRVMLTPDGGFPSEKITSRFVERTFGEDELKRSHPSQTFAWVYKASRNWGVLKDFIPGMKELIDSDPVSRRYLPGNGEPTLEDTNSVEAINFSPIFKQLFCIAAQGLATRVHEPLERLGALFEEPLETGISGATKPGKVLKEIRRLTGTSQVVDIENDPGTLAPLGQGKYLFVTRELSKADVTKFASLGFRFGTVQQVSVMLSKNMQQSQQEITRRLERMQLSLSLDHLPPPGVHLACFMIRPSIRESFDVLVSSKKQNQLPMTSLPMMELDEWHVKVLREFDELSVREVLRNLVSRAGEFELEKQFCWHVHSALARLVDLVGDSKTMMEAKFSSKQILIPCRPTDGSQTPATCTILTVRLMAMLHHRNFQSALAFVPLKFFSAQHIMESGLEDEQAFARRMRLEFGHCANQRCDFNRPTWSSRGTSLDFTNPSLGGIRVQTDIRIQTMDTGKPPSLFRFSKFRPPRTSDDTHVAGREKDWSEDEQEGTHTPTVTPTGAQSEVEISKTGNVIELIETERKATFVNELMALFRL